MIEEKLGCFPKLKLRSLQRALRPAPSATTPLLPPPSARNAHYRLSESKIPSADIYSPKLHGRDFRLHSPAVTKSHSLSHAGLHQQNSGYAVPFNKPPHRPDPTYLTILFQLIN